MDQIEIIRRTPLRFHKIYVLFFLPIGLVGNGLLLFQSLQLVFKAFGAMNFLTFVERILYVLLTIQAFRGLLCYKRSGVYCVFALQGLSIVLSLTLGVIMLNSDTPVYGYSYLVSCLLSGAIILYYAKRLKAFSKEGLTVEEVQRLVRPEEEVKVNVYEPQQVVEYEEPEPEIVEYDCPRCGYHISDGAVFCSKCGAQVRKINH